MKTTIYDEDSDPIKRALEMLGNIPVDGYSWVHNGNLWEKHENHIIGNRSGLVLAAIACLQAVSTGFGSAKNIDAGVVGIKCLDKIPQESRHNQAVWSNKYVYTALLLVFIVAILTLAVIGLISLFK